MPQETCEVKRRGENVDRALRRLKKALDKEGIIKGMRSKRFYEKPSKSATDCELTSYPSINLLVSNSDKLPMWELLLCRRIF